MERALLRREAGVVRREGNKEHTSPALLASLTLSNKGKIPGGSKHAGYEGAIELTSFQPTGIRTGIRGPAAGRAGAEKKGDEPMEVSIGKFTDDSSQLLMQAAVKGEHLTEAKFEWVKADEKGNLSTYHAMEFSDGIVTSYQTGGGGEPRPSEQFSLSLKPKK